MSIRDWFTGNDEETRADRDYQALFRVVKELDKQGLKKLLEGIEAMWTGYDTVRRIKTRDEKEDEKEAKESKEISDVENGNFLTSKDEPVEEK